MKVVLKKAFNCALAIISIVNVIAVIIFWVFLHKVEKGLEGYLPFNFEQFLSFQANQYSVLQIYFVVFSILLGILAIFGFNTIQKACEDTTKEKGDQIYTNCIKIVKDFITEQKSLGTPSHPNSNEATDENRHEVTNSDI